MLGTHSPRFSGVLPKILPSRCRDIGVSTVFRAETPQSDITLPPQQHQLERVWPFNALGVAAACFSCAQRRSWAQRHSRPRDRSAT